MQLRIRAALFSYALVFGLALLPQSSMAYGAPNESLWQPPLGKPLRVSAPYDLANGPFQAGHRGIDMHSSGASPVASPANGTVTFAGTVVDRPLLSIRVDEATIVSLEPLATSLKVGDTVTSGDLLGTVAAGGHCANLCLHLGVRVNGNYVNPMRFFIGRAILVPW